ncbi:hypothetical protein [Nocardia amamiensis]|uniref:hypothetical protein n=1 Tax=Nocardia TaxID=1817 RepID=UPI0033F03995
MPAPDVGRGREIHVSAEDFKVIRQLTFELANVPRESMIESGWTPTNGDFLKRLARSVPSQIAAPTRVTVVVLDEEVADPILTDHSGTEVAPASSDDVVRFVPRPVAHVWPKLLRAAFEALGGLETRYRTGFHEGEVMRALQTIGALDEL